MWRGKKNRNYAKGLPWFRDWYRFQKSNFPAEKGLKLLEVGCAGSRWLPIYVRDFDYSVVGVDYDPNGCVLAADILSYYGLHGEVICEDFFDFALKNKSSFDLIVSFGVVEHFAGVEFVQLIFSCLKEGGKVFAEVPNFQGLQGIASLLMEDWKSTHIQFTPESLVELFANAGFINIKLEYAGGLGLPIHKPIGWRKFLLPIHLIIWAWIAFAYLLSSIFNWSTRGKGSASSIMLVAQKPIR